MRLQLRRLAVGVLLAGCLVQLPRGFGEGPATPAKPPEPAEQRAEGPGLWRTPEKDSLNVLYVFLALSGQRVEYDALQKALPARGGKVSISTLKDTAQRLGLPAQVRRCGVDDLTPARLPAIALMEESRGVGSFVLLVSIQEAEVNIVDGSGSYSRISMDQFRRGWTGYVLFRRDQVYRGWMVSIASVVVALVGCWWRGRPLSRPAVRTTISAPLA